LPTYKVPATVKWSEIRALIGDKRTEDIITLKYGPTLLGPPTIKLQKEGIEHMLAHLEGRTVPGLKSGFYQAIPAIFRAYFQESPRARGKMIIWLKKKLDAAETVAEPVLEGESLAKTAEQVVAQTKRGSFKKKNRTAVGVK
jgi:hypothetical protein